MNDTIRKYSAGGIVYSAGKVLTIKWLSKDWIEFPKGTIEPNETKEETSIREVFEETGYKTKIIKPLGEVTFEFDWSNGKHYKKTVYQYLSKLVDDSEPTPNREDNEDYENIWMTIEDANKQLTYDSDRNFLLKATETIEQL